MLKHITGTVFLLLIINGLTAQSTGDILLKMQQFGQMCNVLYVAAHPDDENTRLIAWLANEKKYRTAYLSLTRGDGGQNLIGAEQGAQLGMIRTQELLAARKIDGGEQYFTRAIDFGYSKNVEETFRMWHKDSVLKDVIWVIRKFRPDVVICRFGTDGSGGHGHHTASAILAEEAFDKAGDPEIFPEQLQYVQPYKPKILAWNYWQDRHQVSGKTVRMDVGGFQPLTGYSYGELAALSRSMHKSQGFGVAKSRGTQYEHFLLLRGEADTNNLFKYIPNAWQLYPGGHQVLNLLQEVINKYVPTQPALSLPRLLDIFDLVQRMPHFPEKAYKLQQLKEIILASAGIYVEATASQYAYTPGDSLHIQLNFIARNLADAQLIKWVSNTGTDSTTNLRLRQNTLYKLPTKAVIPRDFPYSSPYWLVLPPYHQGLQRLAHDTLTGMPDNGQTVYYQFIFNLQGRMIDAMVPVLHKWVDPVDGEKLRPLEILPAVTMKLSHSLMVCEKDKVASFQITLSAHKSGVKGTLTLQAPAGWQVTPSTIPFALSTNSANQTFNVKITPPQKPTDSLYKLKCHLLLNNDTLNMALQRINYAHIPPLTLLHKAEMQLLLLRNKRTVQKIGYLPGAGDEVASCLQMAGYEVHMLDESQILNEKLSQYKAIVIGVRAYNVHDYMPKIQQKLLEFVKSGGNLVVQYNTNNWLSSLKCDLGPYPFQIGRNRVTDEHAEPIFILPNHPVWHYPNKITKADFEGWVQERGIYFVSSYDKNNYQAPLGLSDPGEPLLDGSLITAKYGKGYFIYTGLSFFRQLPAGVPGAYRLFTNLIELK